MAQGPSVHTVALGKLHVNPLPDVVGARMPDDLLSPQHRLSQRSPSMVLFKQPRSPLPLSLLLELKPTSCDAVIKLRKASFVPPCLPIP